MANKSRETANLVSSTGISTLSTRVDVSNGPLLVGTTTSIGTNANSLQVTGAATITGDLVGFSTTSLHFDYNKTLNGRIMASGPDSTTLGEVSLIVMSSIASPYVEVLRASKDARIGIGITNPGAKLQVVPTSSSIAGLFSGTTSSDMVRITQLGTGNALVVEDETNPDSSPFVVTASGSVGIGTTNTSSSFEILTSLYPTAKVNSTYTSASRQYTSVFFGPVVANKTSTIGNVNDTVTPTNSFFHITPYGKTEGSSLTINNTSGNIGFGTTTPEEVFHLGGASNKQIKVDSATTIPGYVGSFNNSFSIAVNRRVSDGTIVNSTRSAAFITLSGEVAGSYITFSTAGTANTQPVGRFIINESGYAGFGTDQTSTVLSRFQVALGESIPADNGNIFTISSASGNLVEKLNMGVTTGYAWIQATKPGTTVRPLVLNPVGSYVGIATTNPGTNLDVNGNIRLSSVGSEIEFNAGGPRLKVPAGNTLSFHNGGGFGSSGNEVFRIDSNANVGIGTTISTNSASKLYVVSVGSTASTVAIGHTKGDTPTRLLLNAGNSTSKGGHPLIASCDASSVNGSSNGWFLYDNNTAGDLQLYRKEGPSAPGTFHPVMACDRSQTQVAIGTDGFYPASVPLYVRANNSSGDCYAAFFGSNSVANYGLNGGIGLGANPTTGDGFVANLGGNNGLAFYTESTGGIFRVASRLSPTGIHTVGNQPSFFAYRSGNQTGMNFNSYDTSVAIYNVTSQNIGGHYSTTTGLFTAPVTGRYAFSAGGSIPSTTIEEAWWIVNGGRHITPMASPSTGIPKAVDAIYLSAGDTIGVHFYDSGGETNGTMEANQFHTYFKGFLIC